MPQLINDWTVNPRTNRSNSSPQYLGLVASVEEVIRRNRESTSSEIGYCIVVDLVFIRGLRPQDADETWAGTLGATTTAFDNLVEEVSRMVKNAAGEIMDRRYEGVSRTIVSLLAHDKGFVPRAAHPV